VAWLANVAHNYFASGDTPQRYGNAHPNIVPYETFETEDGLLALAIGNDKQYRRFCKLVERQDLWEDDRFQSNAGRVEHREELTSSLRSLFQQRTTYAWLELLIAADIPVARINDVPTILTDPQVKARRMVQQVEHSTVGRIKLLGPVPKLSRTPAQIYQAPPPLGWDTNELLSKRLGYSRTTIESLRNEGVI
jgi:crotonobetainyl-CoA:carnitine CoA-transferase CaiB-like acyl-CoA transferase